MHQLHTQRIESGTAGRNRTPSPHSLDLEGETRGVRHLSIMAVLAEGVKKTRRHIEGMRREWSRQQGSGVSRRMAPRLRTGGRGVVWDSHEEPCRGRGSVEQTRYPLDHKKPSGPREGASDGRDTFVIVASSTALPSHHADFRRGRAMTSSIMLHASSMSSWVNSEETEIRNRRAWASTAGKSIGCTNSPRC